jgi:hypothetical protein
MGSMGHMQMVWIMLPEATHDPLVMSFASPE